MNVHLRPSHLLQPAVRGLVTQPGRTATWRLGWPGLDPAHPSLDIIDFDHSGSVTAPGGTDPIGNRFREAAHAIQTVKRWTTTSNPKVAVIHFDQPSMGNSGVVRLVNRGGMLRLHASLRQPAGAGTSDLGPSLTEAERLAVSHADHEIRLTILSDFELTDNDPTHVYERLAAFPGQVHAVVLNAEPPPELKTDTITITRLRYDDPPGALATAIHRSLTTNRPGARRG